MGIHHQPKSVLKEANSEGISTGNGYFPEGNVS